MIFRENLVQLRVEHNLLQKDLAKELGISLHTYQRYEYGEREPSLSKLIAIAEYFDVSMDYLAGRTDKREVNR